MAEYIERERLRKALYDADEITFDGLDIIDNFHAADVVSKAAYDQVAWERNLAEEQLKSIGKSLGEKMDDVQPLLEYGGWTAEGNDEYGNYWDECTACRKAVWFPPFVKNDYKYCPHCGAKMDGGI